MTTTPKPDDFFSEKPPARIIGTESECNVQLAPGCTQGEYISLKALKKAGYISIAGEGTSNVFLDNGTRLYVTMDQLEIATGEALGPRMAAAADRSAIVMLSNIVQASGVPHDGVYRNSGAIVRGVEKSNGYHENYMFPRSISKDPLFETALASHLTSCVFLGSGMLSPTGFQLFQKVNGIGNPPIERSINRRTVHGQKPMAMIPPVSADADTVGNEDWARLEVRYADPSMSLTAQYLGFATMSLVLRIIEHSEVVGVRKLRDFSFKNHAETAKRFSRDLTFSAVAETENGAHISAVSFQEILIEAIKIISEKIELPEDEVRAIGLWQAVCERLRKCNLNTGEYAGLVTLFDFAARHRYLSTRFESNRLNSDDPEALEASIIWDRILPAGGGMSFWSKVPSPFVTLEEVNYLLHNPAPTRATARGSLIKEEGITKVGWSLAERTTGEVVRLRDSYATSVE